MVESGVAQPKAKPFAAEACMASTLTWYISFVQAHPTAAASRQWCRQLSANDIDLAVNLVDLVFESLCYQAICIDLAFDSLEDLVDEMEDLRDPSFS